MQIDNKQLNVGDPIYHLWLGAGTIKSASKNSAVGVFSRQEIIISNVNLSINGVKVFGLGQPLIYWPNNSQTDTSKYLPIIKAVEAL
jgi:hypothetical protein